MDAMRAQLASTPAEVVVANHCYGLFELAAIYLSQTPPMLFQARLAIDGLGAILDGLKGRLGEAEPALIESLSQLRLAYVRLESAERLGRRRARPTATRPDVRPTQASEPIRRYGRRARSAALASPSSVSLDEGAQLAAVERALPGTLARNVECHRIVVPAADGVSVTTAR